jgi:hypothetical protein
MTLDRDSIELSAVPAKRDESWRVREGDINARLPYFDVLALMGPDPDPLAVPDTDEEPWAPEAAPQQWGQPVRWPTERPVILLGWNHVNDPDMHWNHRYLHLGPLTFLAEFQNGYLFRVGLTGRSFSASAKLRISARYRRSRLSLFLAAVGILLVVRRAGGGSSDDI